VIEQKYLKEIAPSFCERPDIIYNREREEKTMEKELKTLFRNRQVKDLFLMDDKDIYAEAKRRIKECRKKKGRKLDFSCLGLNEIPPEITKLETLKELDITNIELKMIPAFIGNIVGLKKMSVGSKCLSPQKREEIILPPELGNLKNLQNLSLGYDIQEIPQWVWGLDNLDALSIYNNEMETIPVEIAQLKKLKKLRIHSTKITTLPGEIGEQLSLTAMDLECPQLGSLPESFTNLKKMRDFRVSQSNLNAVPVFICDWVELKTLDISFYYSFHNSVSKLKGIPKNIGMLENLKYLCLSGPGITKIPDSIGNCPLEHLEIYGNYKNLPMSFGNLVNLKFLKLRSGKSILLPDSFGNLLALEKLEIHAPVIKIPSTFGKLKALENLSVINGKGLVLPKDFGGLSALKEMFIIAPDMQKIPYSIGGCKNLKSIHLESDKISILPESFCNIKNLEELYLDTFALKALPVNFGYLTALKNLDIFSGALAALPDSMGSLKKLKSLRLDIYKIKNLPDWFKKLSYVRERIIHTGKEKTELSVHGNSKKKQGTIDIDDFSNMSSTYCSKLLSLCSIRELESVICSAVCYNFPSEKVKDAYRVIIINRNRRLNRKFKWTEENINRIARVSDEFLKAWEDGFQKAKMLLDTLYEKEQNKDMDYFRSKYNIEITLCPYIVCSEKNQNLKNRLYDVINDYLVSEVDMQLGYNPETKNEDGFRHSNHISRDLSWNIEGFGDYALEDHYICYALHILYSHNNWAIEDIANINSISIEIKLSYEGEDFRS